MGRRGFARGFEALEGVERELQIRALMNARQEPEGVVETKFEVVTGAGERDCVTIAQDLERARERVLGRARRHHRRKYVVYVVGGADPARERAEHGLARSGQVRPI